MHDGSRLTSVVFRLSRGRLESLKDLSRSTRIRQSEYLREAIFSPDGRRLMAYGGITKNEAAGIPRSFGVAMLWDASARQTARSLNASTQAIHDVAVSPDGRRFVTAGEDHVVRVWDAASGSLLREITGHRAPCKSLAFGNDPQQVLVAGGSDAILWNCETGERLQTFEKPSDAGDWRIHGAALRPDGKQVALADGAQGRVQVFDVATGHRELELQERVQFISYSPDGSLLALSYHFDRHGELKIVDAVRRLVRSNPGSDPFPWNSQHR